MRARTIYELTEENTKLEKENAELRAQLAQCVDAALECKLPETNCGSFVQNAVVDMVVRQITDMLPKTATGSVGIPTHLLDADIMRCADELAEYYESGNCADRSVATKKLRQAVRARNEAK